MHHKHVESAGNTNGFGLDHLPYGAFKVDATQHLCTRVGDVLVDLHTAAAAGALPLPEDIRMALQAGVLNLLLRLGPSAWLPLRAVLQHELPSWLADPDSSRSRLYLHRVADQQFVLPLDVTGFIDFYASEHHARRVGELFRPDNPLLPNYEHVPIAYNGRASSVAVSGTDFVRPHGQQRAEPRPLFAPTRMLDFETELGLVMGADAEIFGVALLNDWSARDIQSWEYQPLGPFLGKSFATTVSAWITPIAALDAHRAPVPEHRERPLEYLWNEHDQQQGGLDVEVSAWISTMQSRAAGLAPMRISGASAATLRWSPWQMARHATSNGCRVGSGDILGTGTISGPAREEAGCLLELTRNGAAPIQLENGESRTWLEDGDEVILRGSAGAITLSECAAKVLPATGSR